MILVAAELYGKDKGIQTETRIKVSTLLNENYIEKDTNQNTTNCTGANTDNGCVINPVDNTSLNNEDILIKISGSNIIAIWNGQLGTTTSVQLVSAIKEVLDCSNLSETNPCLFGRDEKDTTQITNPNNYLYNSGIMWRILGIYKIDGNEVVKMITDDTVVWELSA